MPKKLIAFILGSAFTCAANAATWYGFTTVGLTKAAYFFDLETVGKQPGSVNLWIKYINAENSPDSDGSYATAIKFVFDCKKRTMQSLIMVTYDKSQNPMRTVSTPSKADEVIPGTVGEAAYKIICAPDFPNTKSDLYVKVGDNDIYAAAHRLLDKVVDPAPK